MKTSERVKAGQRPPDRAGTSWRHLQAGRTDLGPHKQLGAQEHLSQAAGSRIRVDNISKGGLDDREPRTQSEEQLRS